MVNSQRDMNYLCRQKKGKMSECWREEQCGAGYNKRRISNEISINKDLPSHVLSKYRSNHNNT